MAEPRTGAGPLHGVRILEFSQIVAGPVAGLNLADLGADVIKVEPLRGDPHRFVGTTVPGESKMYQGNNRGKRCIALDLHRPEGVEVIRRLAPSIDAVVINYRLGVAKRLGIDYDSLRQLRPDIIYAQISGFGERAGGSKGGSDIVAQAHSGLMAMDGKLDSDGNPALIGVPVSDYAAGLSIAMAVCAALYHRAMTGDGQYISTSLLRAGLHLQNRYVMREPMSDSAIRDQMVQKLREARAAGQPFAEQLKVRTDNARLASPFALFYRAYQAKDGSIVLGALTPQNRAAIRRVLGMEGENSDDPGFDARDPANIEANKRWKEWMERRMAERTVAEWLQTFERAGVPVAPVNFPEEMSEDPAVLAEGLIEELDHPVTGPQRVVGPIVEMTATPTGSPRPSPALGQHTREVLEEAGYAAPDVDSLLKGGVARAF